MAQETTGKLVDMNGEELEESLREVAAEPVPPDRAHRFYDRIRAGIHHYVESKGGAVEKTAEFLLLVPDIFILLWRLVNDGRVNGKNKVLLGSSIAYFLFPLDIVPEAIVGALGYLDDLVFAVFVLNRMLNDVDADILREHWSGDADVLDTIQNVLHAADNLIGSEMVEKIKKMVK